MQTPVLSLPLLSSIQLNPSLHLLQVAGLLKVPKVHKPLDSKNELSGQLVSP